MYLDTSSDIVRGADISRADGCFADFPAATQLLHKQRADMMHYQFHLVPCKATRSVILQAVRDDELILSAHLPSSFARGDIHASCFQVRGKEMLCFAAHSQRMTGNVRHWFGIFGADGHKIYVSSLEHRVSRAKPQDDGISLFFENGDAIRVRL